MNLHKSLTMCALVATFAFGGVSCTLFGGGSANSADEAAASVAYAEQAAQAAAVKSSASPQRNPIKQELDRVGRKLVGMAADNVTPKKSHMTAVKNGNIYVAKYTEVDRDSLSTSMQAKQKGQYVGFIRYVERHYECRGKTKAEAVKALDCRVMTNRHMKEMVRYDGKKWHY